MIDAVIVSTARTGLAKSWKGAFNMTYGATLGGHAVQHAVARSGIDPELRDQLAGRRGCGQRPQQDLAIARMLDDIGGRFGNDQGQLAGAHAGLEMRHIAGQGTGLQPHRQQFQQQELQEAASSAPQVEQHQ